MTNAFQTQHMSMHHFMFHEEAYLNKIITLTQISISRDFVSPIHSFIRSLSLYNIRYISSLSQSVSMFAEYSIFLPKFIETMSIYFMDNDIVHDSYFRACCTTIYFSLIIWWEITKIFLWCCCATTYQAYLLEINPKI